jgi:hypothetical protein
MVDKLLKIQLTLTCDEADALMSVLNYVRINKTAAGNAIADICCALEEAGFDGEHAMRCITDNYGNDPGMEFIE